MNSDVNPQAVTGWLDVIKNDPVVIAVFVIGIVVGALLMYLAIRKGYISTPAMQAKFDALHEENEDLRIEIGSMRKEMALMRENDRKYQALVDRVMAAYQIEIPNVTNKQEKKDV